MTEYSKYKSSGAEWLGEIPEHWETGRLKYYMDYEKGKSPKELKTMPNEGSQVYLSMDYLRGNDKHISYVENPKDYVQVEEDEILLLWDGSNAGEFILSKKGVLSSTIAVIKLSGINKSFGWYYFSVLEKKLKQSTIGMGIPHVSSEELKNSILIIPPVEEQENISNSLDKKVAEINQLIDNKKKLLQLYQEQKVAIINLTVKKGINSEVPLKDTGIELLGEIPEHWEVKKIKYLTSKVGSGSTPRGGASVYKLSGIPFLRSQNIHFNGLNLDDVVYISEDVHDNMDNSKVLAGDVLLNITGASIGRCFFVEDSLGEANVNQHVCIVRSGEQLYYKFLYFVLRSRIGQEQIGLEQTGSGREGLNFEALKNFDIPLPEMEEQKTIVNHIEDNCDLINAKINKIEQLIELFVEYRNALVGEVVTGKIKVAE